MPQSVISEHFTKSPESLAKQGISGQKGANQNYDNSDKNTIHLPRQEVAFSEKSRKIKGYVSLKRDFYTRFIPKFYGIPFTLISSLQKTIDNLNLQLVNKDAEVNYLKS